MESWHTLKKDWISYLKVFIVSLCLGFLSMGYLGATVVHASESDWASKVKITLLGDSLSVGLVGAGWDSTFKNGNSFVKGSRWLNQSSVSADLDGLRVMQQNASAFNELLVVALGTNGGITKAQMDEFIGAVPSQVKRIVFINTDSAVSHKDEVDRQIKDAAKRYNNVDYIDWMKYSQSKGSWLYPSSDPVHMSDYKPYLEWIVTQLYKKYGKGLGNADDTKNTGCIAKTSSVKHPDWGEYTWSSTKYTSHVDKLKNMSVRMAEPDWMSIEALESLFKHMDKYQKHKLNGKAEEVLRLSDKYGINTGVWLGQVWLETKWGGVGCPAEGDATSPYNYGCVMWAGNSKDDLDHYQYKEYGFKATPYMVAGRYWPLIDDPVKGIDLSLRIYNRIAAEDLNGNNKYGDVLEVYSPAADMNQGHGKFMADMWEIVVEVMKQDPTNKAEKTPGGCETTSNGNDSNNVLYYNSDWEFDEGLIPNMPVDRDYKDDAIKDRLFMPYSDLTVSERVSVQAWKDEGISGTSDFLITWGRRGLAIVGLIAIIFPSILLSCFVFDIWNPLGNSMALRFLTNGRLAVDFDKLGDNGMFSKVKSNKTRLVGVGDVMIYSLISTLLGISILSTYIFIQLNGLYGWFMNIKTGLGL